MSENWCPCITLLLKYQGKIQHLVVNANSCSWPQRTRRSQWKTNFELVTRLATTDSFSVHSERISSNG